MLYFSAFPRLQVGTRFEAISHAARELPSAVTARVLSTGSARKCPRVRNIHPWLWVVQWSSFLVAPCPQASTARQADPLSCSIRHLPLTLHLTVRITVPLQRLQCLILKQRTCNDANPPNACLAQGFQVPRSTGWLYGAPNSDTTQRPRYRPIALSLAGHKWLGVGTPCRNWRARWPTRRGPRAKTAPCRRRVCR
jgi:hypothetical protein